MKDASLLPSQMDPARRGHSVVASDLPGQLDPLHGPTDLTEEIGATANEGLWIINAYPLVMAGLLLGAGTLGDRVEHRRMFLTGMSIFGMASLVAAFSPNPEVLIAARAILAVGAASMMPATLALIRVAFTNDRERNVAIAVWGSVAVLGGALGPIVSGLLLEQFWWGSVFLINVPVAVIALVAALFVAPPNDPDPTKKWDLLSSVYAMITLVGAVVAIKEIAHRPPSALVIGGALAAAVIGAVLFTRRQAGCRIRCSTSPSSGTPRSLLGFSGLAWACSRSRAFNS